MNATRHILAAALAPRTGRGALVAAGVVADPTPAAAPLDPATELACAAMLYLIRRPDFQAARRRLRAACDALPLPPLGALSGELLDLRIAAEMALRGSRSEAGMRNTDRMLRARLELYCVSVRRSLDAELAAVFAAERDVREQAAADGMVSAGDVRLRDELESRP
jgi:hypothetical protein